MQVSGNMAGSIQVPVTSSGDQPTAATGGNGAGNEKVITTRQQPSVSEASPADLLKQGGADANFQLSFSIDKDSKELVVKVINPVTNEVIRQIPPQELLNLAASLQQTAGILVNKQV